jgi:hypothetical protein
MDEFEILDTQWADKLQAGLEEYMDMLNESIWEGKEDEVETLSGQPWCGCNTCHYREILSYVTPKIIAGYKEERVK